MSSFDEVGGYFCNPLSPRIGMVDIGLLRPCSLTFVFFEIGWHVLNKLVDHRFIYNPLFSRIGTVDVEGYRYNALWMFIGSWDGIL